LGVKLLFLLPSFEYSFASRQVSLLAPVLRSAHGIEVQVAAWRADGPAAEWLRASGVSLFQLGRRFPPTAWRSLRRLVGELRPDVVHAWRLPALRVAALLHRLGRSPFRLVVSEPRLSGRLNPLDLWLLRAADVLIAGFPNEADAVGRLDIAADRIRSLPPAVAIPTCDPPLLPVRLAPNSKIVMCIGNLTRPHAFRDAVWAADILRYPLPDLHLVLIGDGPGRDRIDRFARGVNPAGGQVHFVSGRPDAAALLARADAVWIPSNTDCGRQVLLEAQAAGRPVVASAVPGLADLIEDNRTGLLTPPGAPVAFARRAWPLFEDTALAKRIGTAGREAVAHLSPEKVAAAYAKLYLAVY
jgi:glycosyltransferase involved in cell wall biosynthesis